MLDVLHSERFVDQSLAEVHATLLEEPTYLCSTRTMYRLLAAAQEVRERRAQARHPAYAKPELVATAPNQIWSWDITKLKGPIPYFYYSLYVILDVFSRYVVGWMVAALFADLRIDARHSRPRVCNDNPFSEAQFRTFKYRPAFPDRFGSIEHARTVSHELFTWYNAAHPRPLSAVTRRAWPPTRCIPSTSCRACRAATACRPPCGSIRRRPRPTRRP